MVRQPALGCQSVAVSRFAPDNRQNVATEGQYCDVEPYQTSCPNACNAAGHPPHTCTITSSPAPSPYAPDCSSRADFEEVIRAIDEACCEPADQEGDTCHAGELVACGVACARVVGPMYEQCEEFLQTYDISILAIMDNARAVCQGGY